MDKGEIGIINRDVFITSGGSNQIKVRRFKVGDFVRIINPTYSHYIVIDEKPDNWAKSLLVEKQKITPIRGLVWTRIK